MIALTAAWLTAAIVFLVLDIAWLSWATPRLYRALLGDLIAPSITIWAAGAFYLLFVTGLVLLAVAPALERGGLMHAALVGGFAGLFAYGTYDLTNQATLRGWDVRITMADMAWGLFVSTASASAAYMVASRM